MKKLLVVLLIVATLVVLLVSGASADEIKENYWSPISGYEYCPETGESVHIMGKSHVVVYQFEESTSNGIVHHYNLNINDTGTGIGMSAGDKYVYHSKYHIVGKVAYFLGQSFTRTDIQNIKLVRQSDGLSCEFRMLYHITFNAIGELASIKTEVDPW